MSQKVLTYAIMAAALAVLLSSTVRIGLAVLSNEHTAHVTGLEVHNNLDDVDIDVNGNYIDNGEEPILPINKRKLAVARGEYGPGGANSDVLPRLLDTSFRGDNIIDDEGPHNNDECGVILYDHNIPGEGGDALDGWIEHLAAVPRTGEHRASFTSSEKFDSKDSFLGEVTNQIRSLGRKDWKIVRSNGKSGLAFLEDGGELNAWRDLVEERNCKFVAAIVFSDALDHSIRRTKRMFEECDCSYADEFKERIMETVVSNPWTGQLDRFLFNSYNGTQEMDMRDKVKRGMELLKKHFSIVMVDDTNGRGADDFATELLRITGWSASRRPKKASISDDGELLYSKELVSKFTKMSSKNGDADFIDAVNHVYHNSLDYLMLQ